MQSLSQLGARIVITSLPDNSSFDTVVHDAAQEQVHEKGDAQDGDCNVKRWKVRARDSGVEAP